MSALDYVGGAIRPRSVTILPRGQAFNVIEAIAVLSTAVPMPNKFQLDVTRTQRHQRTLTSMEHPVEFGVDITDHTKRDHDVLEVDGVISDTPLALFGVLGALGVIRNHAHNEARKLNEFFERREPVFVATSIRVYESMLIEALEFGRASDTGKAIEVRMRLREVRILSPQLVPELEDLDALLYGGEGTVDKGTQSTEAANLTDDELLEVFS